MEQTWKSKHRKGEVDGEENPGPATLRRSQDRDAHGTVRVRYTGRDRDSEASPYMTLNGNERRNGR